MQRFTTLTNLVEELVIPALGDLAADYDVEAIAREISTYAADVDARTGITRDDTAGFEITADEDAFWSAVAQHDTTA